MNEDEQDQEPLEVLDLPQLYQRPPAPLLLSTLADLRLTLPSWDAGKRATQDHATRGHASQHKQRLNIRHEGVPSYLTRIIASPLRWLDGDEVREQVWEAASQRLSERSGRTAMGAMTRKFIVPMKPRDEAAFVREGAATQQSHDTSDWVEIVLNEPALTEDNLGLKTWASSYLLAKRLPLLMHSLPELPIHATLLELGSGTGLVGFAAASFFHRHVVMTDLPDIVPNLQWNLRRNVENLAAHGGTAEVAVLNWSDPAAFVLQSGKAPAANSFQMILAADPIYSTDHPRLLVQAIDQHLCRDALARVIIELPLRDAFAAERQDLWDRLCSLGLVTLHEGEEIGYDDWVDGSDGQQLAEVTCWWSVWAWLCYRSL